MSFTPSSLYPSHKIGLLFRKKLKAALGEKDFLYMCHTNHKLYLVDKKFNVCASHDYVDANHYMDEAWHEVTGNLIDLHNEGQIRAWGDAWRKARLFEYELVTPN